MGTNENVKNDNANVNEFANVKNTANTGDKSNISKNDPIDMQATQRIEILDGLKKDTENSLKVFFEKKQDELEYENENAKNMNDSVHTAATSLDNVSLTEKKINIQNSSSEISTEPNAQAENHSAVNISKNNVQKNPNQQSQKVNMQEENKTKVSDTIETSKENIQEISSEQEQKNKEKQHAQDKKDYRLEKMLFDRINKMQGKIKESLELIKKFERINAKEENLPNIVTTLHDKLTHEVIKQFRTVGIEFNMKSYLVQSVVSDLLGKFEDGITEFKDCSENLNFVREVQEDFESRVELAPTSKVKNFFARLRGMFKPERKQEKLEQLERGRQEKKLEEANIHLIKYKFINSELEKYTIRKNIVNSLSKEIIHGQGSSPALNISNFVNEKIAPEMRMLGLENSIPTLLEKVYQEYKEKDPSISKEQFLELSIGDIRRNIRLQKSDMVHAKINKVMAGNVQKTEDEERMIG